MVTDEQYRALQDRVSDLEKRLAAISRQFTALLMRRDAAEEIPKQREASVARRDTTRYRFENKLMCKRRLVLECVKKFVVDKNVTNSGMLKNAFPDYIQGSLGVVKAVEEAERYSEAHRRFYFADEDVIKLRDSTMVVCSQWDVKNISRFINLMIDHGYSIEIIERKY